ncbi:uncharacterized protein VTP21DRAFT_6203 [Calcarisporiella thermophila]|uniref:uncharacterized protein n=1 Tax=Calcarisporiella thermophila TaxID=911321 RepID=UPI0037444407
MHRFRHSSRVRNMNLALYENIDSSKAVAVLATDPRTGNVREITYKVRKIIGSGSFGTVYQVRLLDSGEDVAIKKVFQDKRFKNRELQIMQMVEHTNVVALKAHFYTSGNQGEEYLNLVLEYVSETVYRVSRQYCKLKQAMPMFFIKLYTYQLLRSLAYIHALGICHRDIKPQNLLVDPTTGILKLCDFGSAKPLIPGEPNVSYICSRYYRAPELIFGATNYTSSIDLWSAGCVMAELMLGRPIFPGESGIDQLVEIIKILGTPTKEQIRTMNPNYMDHRFPQIRAQSLDKLFKIRNSPDAIDLLSHLLIYNPKERFTAIEAICHPFFDELRDQGTRMLGGGELPPLFDFSELELLIRPDLVHRLVPSHIRPILKTRGIDVNSLIPQSHN